MDWYNFVRDVCAEYFTRNSVVIGGPGVAVEIDESKFGCRKYNGGHWQEGHCVFGGIERGSGKSFMVEVPQRNAATLLSRPSPRKRRKVYSEEQTEWIKFFAQHIAQKNFPTTIGCRDCKYLQHILTKVYMFCHKM